MSKNCRQCKWYLEDKFDPQWRDHIIYCGYTPDVKGSFRKNGTITCSKYIERGTDDVENI